MTRQPRWRRQPPALAWRPTLGPGAPSTRGGGTRNGQPSRFWNKCGDPFPAHLVRPLRGRTWVPDLAVSAPHPAPGTLHLPPVLPKPLSPCLSQPYSPVLPTHVQPHTQPAILPLIQPTHPLHYHCHKQSAQSKRQPPRQPSHHLLQPVRAISTGHSGPGTDRCPAADLCGALGLTHRLLPSSLVPQGSRARPLCCSAALASHCRLPVARPPPWARAWPSGWDCPSCLGSRQAGLLHLGLQQHAALHRVDHLRLLVDHLQPV